jgi:hypothetical protein
MTTKMTASLSSLPSLLLMQRADELPDALSVEWNGHHPCEKLHEDANIRVLRCTFEPGDMHVRHSHQGRRHRRVPKESGRHRLG